MKNSVLSIVLLVLVIATEAITKSLEFNKIKEAASTQVQLMNNRLATIETSNCILNITNYQTIPGFNKDEILAWVFELSPCGFLVVAADDNVSPIIAYSEYENFSFDENDILYNMIQEDLTLRLSFIDKMPEEKLKAYRHYWQLLITDETPFLDAGNSWPPTGQTKYGGWVESIWTQSSPYNNKCPMDPVTNQRCLAGCPSIAMGQIINFWQYPDSVIFEKSDSYVSKYLGRTIPIDAPAASIPWINYNQGNPSDEVCANLVYACGVSTKTVYSSKGSGVFTNSVCADALKKHFYFTTADFRTGDSGNFYQVLEQNMKDSMPAIIVIVGSKGGHTLVCDGLRKTQTTNEWHLNFGWGAYQPKPLSSCWYVLPDSLPKGLDTLYEAIVNIKAPRRPKKVFINDALITETNNISINIPNLFTPSSLISYNLPSRHKIRLTIWDASGRCVRNLLDKVQSKGQHFVSWNGLDDTGATLAEGIYFVRINANHTTFTQKVLFIQ